MLITLLPIASLLLMSRHTHLFWYLCPPLLILTTFISCMKFLQAATLTIMTTHSSLDLMSAALIILTIWVVSMMFQASLKILLKLQGPKIFTLVVIILLLSLILCFSASNIFIFYIWFEASLIPTMLLIMLWGYQPERTQASMYLIMYTVLASLPLLISISLISKSASHTTMAFPFLSCPPYINPSLIWMITLLAFMVKLPLFSLHLWLPKAHVEAPVAGSMILAAILLKLGGYGMARMVWLFPQMNYLLAKPMISIAMLGASLTSLICLRQPDLKSIIAYSSIGHMGLMVTGLLCNSLIGMYGALMMMMAHGFSSSALFCMSNITYEYTHTRSLPLTKGILMMAPNLSTWWFILICMNMAAPPSINLLSEIMLITASLSFSLTLAPLIMLLSFLTAAYSLHTYSSINHGMSISNSNSFHPMFFSNHLLIFMHMAPVLLLILSPSLISSWL